MAWTLTVIAGLSFAIWLYLLGFRGGFWHADQRLEAEPGAPEVGGESAMESLAVVKAGIESVCENRHVDVAEILASDD